MGDAGLEACGAGRTPAPNLPFLPCSGLLPLPPLAKPSPKSVAAEIWGMQSAGVTLLGDRAGQTVDLKLVEVQMTKIN